MDLPLTEPAYIFVVLFAVILVAPLVAERLRAPGIIGLILAGALVGQGGVGLLERTGPIEALGNVGLLYLMFLAGVELDIEGFREHRHDSVIFGTTTLVVPMLVNTAAALLVGLEPLAAVLVASAFTSHTLIVYPLVQRYGLARSRAVVATLGGTLLSNVAALLVLAVVAAIHTGDHGAVLWARFGVGLGVFGLLTMWGLPRLTRWFFSGLGQDRAVRFTFVLVALFAASACARAVGIEPIVGAFLAGLALNRFVPEGSALAERLSFLGSSLLVPLFLIATGMLIDLAAVIRDPRALVAGSVFTASALGAKWLAAWPPARLAGLRTPDLGVMFSLSSAQAAGALAAVIVAVNIGLVDQWMVDAVVLVMLGTCVAASAAAARFAPRAARPARRAATLGQAVVVPIANPGSAEPLVKLAAHVAEPDAGAVLPVTVLSYDAPHEEVEENRAIGAEAEQVALRHGAEARSVVRIDASPTAGVLHTILEGGGTCVLLGWKGYANAREHFFGGVIDTVLARLRVPALVCRPGKDSQIRRIVLSVTPGDLAPAGAPALDLAVDVATRLARSADVQVLVVSEQDDPRLRALVVASRRAELVIDQRKPPIALRSRVEPGDVVVVGTSPTRAGLGHNASRLARTVADHTVVVTVPRLS